MDISKLSKEEKLKLFDALQEKKRRLKLKKSNYVPNKGQMLVHKSKATLRFCASGNGSGKTTLAIQEALWRAKGYNPITGAYTKVPAKVAVVLDKPDKADKVWLPEIKKWTEIESHQMHKRGKPNLTEISFENGSVITFYSHDQDPLTFESIEIDEGIFDEPPPRSVYVALRRGGRKKDTNPRFLIIGTPLYQPWLRVDLWDKWAKGELKDVECFKFSADVNKDNIDWKALQKWYDTMNEREINVRRHGAFSDLEGLALANLWNREIHIIDKNTFQWDDNFPCVLAIDPHPSKAHHGILLGADRDNQLYVLKEIKLKVTPREFALHLKRFIDGFRIIDIVVDSLGSSDMTGGEGFKSFIQVLNEEGIRARATTYEEKQDEAFIARIQDALLIPEEPNNFGQKIPKLRVLDTAIGTITDIEQVQWTRDKKNDQNKPKLDITHKDFLSCLKYALATNLYGSKGKTKVTYKMQPSTYGGPRPAVRQHKLKKLMLSYVSKRRRR